MSMFAAPSGSCNAVIETAAACRLSQKKPSISNISPFRNCPNIVNFELHASIKKIRPRFPFVPPEKAATDVLIEHGYKIDVKCSDGICGVCQCGLVAGEVEHRDFVLSKAQRQHTIILCQSRAAQKDGVVEIDL